jgi:hypothetical protein
MKKKLSLLGTLFFVFIFLSLSPAGTTLGLDQAQVKPAGTGGSFTQGTVASHQCTIASVAAVEIDSNIISGVNRIYVQCANSPGGGLFSFASAVDATAGNANRYLVLLNTAVALGKTVTIFYDINFVNNPAGCQSDCRKLTGLVLGP